MLGQIEGQAKALRDPLTEEGVVGTDAMGGDDPGYVKDMYGFFAANQKSIAYESYFDDTGTSIYNPVQNPQASAEYIKLWR